LLADKRTGNLDTTSADELFAPLRGILTELGTTVLLMTRTVARSQRCDTANEVIDGQVTGD
jgi:predicted ABC-type transport system involved in lysophospholipase L1 biosynthesis ATPase subunit